jgi:hypothetical protein
MPEIQVARNLLGPPNQAPSPPRPAPHWHLAAAAVRVRGTASTSRTAAPGAARLGGAGARPTARPRLVTGRSGLLPPAACWACCSFGTVQCGTVAMPDCPGATGAEQRHRDCLWTPCPASLQPPAPRQRIGSWRAARRVKRQMAGNAVRQPLQRYASGSGIRSALIIMPSRRWTKQQDLASQGAPRSSLVCAWPRSHREACALLLRAPELLETSRLKRVAPCIAEER